MTGTIIVPVQAVLAIELLTVILVRLDVVRCREHPAERIVMVRFLNYPALADDHTVIPLVVFQAVIYLAYAPCGGFVLMLAVFLYLTGTPPLFRFLFILADHLTASFGYALADAHTLVTQRFGTKQLACQFV